MDLLRAGIDEFFWASKDKVKIDDIEIENGPIIQTYDLLKILTAKYPQYDLNFTMGSD